MTASDTITAIATANGRAAVGIVRISGPKTHAIAKSILNHTPIPRHAHYGPFYNGKGTVLDQGIALFFPGPHSFTGKDVLELQGHGGPVVLDLLLQAITEQGARLARPGEFSEQAFLNDKLDLSQAEAIADLIDASSEQAARNAVRSLQGVFSTRVNQLLESLTQLRTYVEAAMDFPEEDIDFLSDGKVSGDLNTLIQQLDKVLDSARQGAILREGMSVVIAGRPNAGKSSLLNALSGKNTAIVTAVEGTTRDVLHEHIHIDGLPLHIIDTAGLRHSSNEVERIGIERAWKEIEAADRVLLLIDSTEDMGPLDILSACGFPTPKLDQLTLIYNKIDLSAKKSGQWSTQTYPTFGISAKNGDGLTPLKQHLKTCMGYMGSSESGFIARRRHIDALQRTRQLITAGEKQLCQHGAGELLAEDLRQAQQALGEITGKFTPDDLLARIFANFCIGK